jgi:hypothetical protein
MFLEKFLKIVPKTIIVDKCTLDLGPLMIRYYLTPKIFNFRLVIHKFLRSDNDRHYHDHPWNFISFLLKGSYDEHMPFFQYYNSPYVNVDEFYIEDKNKDTVLRHKRFSLIRRPKWWKHWVELGKDDCCNEFISCYTLVLLYGKRREWGFHTEKGWVKHTDYDCC